MTSLRDLEQFAQEKGKELTPFPIHVEFDSSIIYERNHGYCLAYISKTTHLLDNSVEYVIYIKKWFFKAFKDRMDVLKKIICHELAHIVHQNHSREFMDLAYDLGAGEFCVASISVLEVTNPYKIWFLTTFGFASRIRKDLPVYSGD